MNASLIFKASNEVSFPVFRMGRVWRGGQEPAVIMMGHGGGFLGAEEMTQWPEVEVEASGLGWMVLERGWL